ncbi:hypothetical protein RND71_027249 [Anisodus tanguticus]|uniref:Uncharacterized protein n=1 Tax=Anisodus tanguticus TaxID=243964 RepID=A0AAE1RMG8_9SOLA|nr:hypothetical protein RND71_027249 [Anisodus tanguticus]
MHAIIVRDQDAHMVDREKRKMEGNEHELMLACVISGTLFSLLGSASFAILWAVNWRPWRIYR